MNNMKMLYYDRIVVSEEMYVIIRQVNQRSVIFVFNVVVFLKMVFFPTCVLCMPWFIMMSMKLRHQAPLQDDTCSKCAI